MSRTQEQTDQRMPILTIRVARGVSLEDLQQVLSDSRLIWVYAERMADTGLGTVVDLVNGKPLGAPENGCHPGVKLERWEHGRAFGPEIEIDWWREGEVFRLRALSNSDLPGPVEWLELEEEATLAAVGGPRLVLLHGSYDTGSAPTRPTWSEARVPRHLAYPVQFGGLAPQRVALLGQDYARQGIVVLTRLIEVVPV
jgi:hypothetical protein